MALKWTRKLGRYKPFTTKAGAVEAHLYYTDAWRVEVTIGAKWSETFYLGADLTLEEAQRLAGKTVTDEIEQLKHKCEYALGIIKTR